MDRKDYSDNPVFLKAEELAYSITQTDAFKEKNMEELQSLIIDCNQIILETTKINYGAICQPRSGCCG